MSYLRFCPTFSIAGFSSTGRRASSVAAGSRHGSPAGPRTGRYQASSSFQANDETDDLAPSAARLLGRLRVSTENALLPRPARPTKRCEGLGRVDEPVRRTSGCGVFGGPAGPWDGVDPRAARPGCGTRTRRNSSQRPVAVDSPDAARPPSRSGHRHVPRRAGPVGGSTGPARGPASRFCRRFCPRPRRRGRAPPPACRTSASSSRASLGPISGTPGTLSVGSPTRAWKSTTCSGRMPHSACRASRSKTWFLRML